MLKLSPVALVLILIVYHFTKQLPVVTHHIHVDNHSQNVRLGVSFALKDITYAMNADANHSTSSLAFNTSVGPKQFDTQQELFEPDVNEDFPVSESDVPKIPHIIHQTYKDLNVPEQFVKYIASFKTHNPDWTYYFWTDESVRKFVQDKFPRFLSVWDNYKSNINRADALRYFVLYEFGGMYADLDVEFLRPLDRATMKYTCIFPPEPPEHGFRLYAPYIIGNAIMMCKPKHPFLKLIIDSLANFQIMADQIDAAGPLFITSMFMKYHNFAPGDRFRNKTSFESNSPYFFKGNMSENDENAVYIPNTHYFMYSVNWTGIKKNFYSNYCDSSKTKMPFFMNRACKHYERRNKTKDPQKYSFTEHHWYQTYTNTAKRVRTFKHLSTAIHDFNVYK